MAERIQKYCLRIIGMTDLMSDIRRNKRSGAATVVFYNILTGEVAADIYSGDYQLKEIKEPWIYIMVVSMPHTASEICEWIYFRMFGRFPREINGYNLSIEFCPFQPNRGNT